MRPTGYEAELLRRLAETPFLDRLELAALSGWSRGAVYHAVNRLERRGTAKAIPHAAELIPPTRRYCLTAAGLHQAAELEGITLETCWSGWTPWPSSTAPPPCRTPPTHTLPLVPGRAVGRRNHPPRWPIAIVPQGLTADRTAFAKRLWRLARKRGPARCCCCPRRGAAAPSPPVAGRPSLRGLLALERDAAIAGPGSPVWRTPSSSVLLNLREALAYVRPSGELPAERPPRRPVLPQDLELDVSEQPVPDCLLPAILKPAEKRALDLLSDWPWLAPAHLGELLGVKQARLFHVLRRLKGLGLAAAFPVEDRRCLALTDRRLASLARRDRAAVGSARQRWSVAQVDPEASFAWRNIAGSRSRQLLRNLEHTQAVHWFLAALAEQSRAQG